MRKINKILIGLILIATMFLGIGYSAIQNITLDITGTITAEKGITLTSVGTYLPTGFSEVAGTSLDTGFVIQDGAGNQYVWVEVPRTTTVYPTAGLSITEFTDDEYTLIETDLQTYAATYRNSSYSDTWYSEAQHGFASSDDYNAHKNKMLKSVYQNGGFYIGRYEAGRTTEGTATLTTPVIQANAYPYNHVNSKQAQTLASEMASGEYTSSLMFGIQWDLTLRYLEAKGATQSELKSDSTSWGNYYNSTYEITNTNAKYSTDDGKTWTEGAYGEKASGTAVLLTTGADSSFSKQGIYDLAGNVEEMTLEFGSDQSAPIVERGNSYLYFEDLNAGARMNFVSHMAKTQISGFRITLF